MSKQKILGLDLGSNSIGWALMESDSSGHISSLIDMGSRIFNKAVEDKTPTPKNVARRNARLARRVIQRRSRRKQRMLNHLVKLNLLPSSLIGHKKPEIILNQLGDPYKLRAKALDHILSPHQLGRVLLHFVQRRGFLSNKKILLGDMIDDPDVMDILNEYDSDEDINSEREKEETAFKKEISGLRDSIMTSGSRTLGEYLSTFSHHECKRNRYGQSLRTDRQMYKDELCLIWKEQIKHHSLLDNNIIDSIEEVIFYQRPLKLNPDRVGKCSLEPSRKKAKMARLECQEFRYLQDINNLRYFDVWKDEEVSLTEEQRLKLVEIFDVNQTISFSKVRKALKLDKTCEFNLEYGTRKLKGNTTACLIRGVLPDWDGYDREDKLNLIEDLLTIQKKSTLKKRLLNHWGLPLDKSVNLCLLEFEPDFSSLSLKAINKLLPFLYNGDIYSTARMHAGYSYEKCKVKEEDKLGVPPKTANPIVNKALHELRRLVNCIIAEYGKPDAIRIEMARDLEMNTKKYKSFIKQQDKNTKLNEEAGEAYKSVVKASGKIGATLNSTYEDKLKYRLWSDQQKTCAYTCRSISLTELFSSNIEVDHIIPYSQSLDDSYMNKVVCFADENRYKGQRTPIDTYNGNKDKWNQITQHLGRWAKNLKGKRERFYRTDEDVQNRDFISNQLNDTRYISKLALTYLKQLGSNITTTKGAITAWLRYQWGLNDLIGSSQRKERSDHRHHAIDAVVVACVDMQLYKALVAVAKSHEKNNNALNVKELVIDPPYQNLKEDVLVAFNNTIVSHAVQRKLSGALHEDTGAGFIDGVGSVFRKRLDPDFKQVDKIYDDTVRDIVKNHIAKYEGKPKAAFADGVTVYHKDAKTPIKRVRVRQSSTDLKKLQKTKLGIKNKEGDIFKWFSYGNIHHVLILFNKKREKYEGRLITNYEASHRVKGINQDKALMVNKNYGDDLDFCMVLYKNDTVSIDLDGTVKFFRIKKLGQLNSDGNPRLTLNLVSDASDSSLYEDTVNNLMKINNLTYCKLNSLGKIIND